MNHGITTKYVMSSTVVWTSDFPEIMNTSISQHNYRYHKGLKMKKKLIFLCLFMDCYRGNGSSILRFVFRPGFQKKVVVLIY